MKIDDDAKLRPASRSEPIKYHIEDFDFGETLLSKLMD